MKFIHNDIAYKEIMDEVKTLADANKQNVYYLTQNAFGRFSLYIQGCKEEELLTKENFFTEKYGAWFDRVSILDEGSLLFHQISVMHKSEMSENLFFIESFLSESSWSGIPSDSKDKKINSKIVCFYSFKGGVGRTTAMVMSAIALARQGKRVALIDFDLEAPGISNILLKKELPKYGVIDFLIESSIYYNEHESSINIDEYIYTCASDEIVGNERGEIYVVPAYGSTSENDLESYKRKLLRVDLNTPMYNNKETPIDFLVQKIDAFVEPDYIFIDSRSGLHQVGGVTITKYSDLVVMLFYGSKQNIAGMKMVLPVVKSNKKEFILVNSQVPNNAEIAQMERQLFIEGAYDALKLCDLNYEEGLVDLDAKDADHYPIDISYNAGAAFINSTEQLLKCFEDSKVEFERLSSMISDFLYVENGETEVSAFDYNAIIHHMEKLTPNVPTAEDEFLEEKDLQDKFYPMSAYGFIFEPRKFLVLGNKGMGKSALFTVLKHNSYAKKLAEYLHSDIKHYQNTTWIVGTDIESDFKDIVPVVVKNKTIRPFWHYQILKSLSDNLGEGLNHILNEKIVLLLSENSLYEVIKKFNDDDEMRYLLGESIKTINKHLVSKEQSITIIYDSLDRIFQEEYRGLFLSELIQIWYDNATVLQSIKSKIFLSNDIFDREVSITDKVKIENYSANIKWELDQLYAMVWKRLISSSDEFKKMYLSEIIGDSVTAQEGVLGFIPQVNEEVNRAILTRLMGMKMGVGKKAATYNWFKNRLSDTNQQIAPRSMLDIFAEAAKIEAQLKNRTSGNTTIIMKPKSFEEALPIVSSKRVADMKEEYPKYEGLFQYLKDSVKKSPIEEPRLIEALEKCGFDNPEREIKNLIDIGIIQSYQRSPKNDVRYHFPDIYLHGLGLSRTGMR